MLLGAHVSVSGGLVKALDRAEEIGAEVLQIFVTSPHSFKITNYSDNEIVTFVKEYKRRGFKMLFFHAVYLINLASEKEYLVKLSEESLIHYMQMGERLGAVGTIVHLGSVGKENQYQLNVLIGSRHSFLSWRSKDRVPEMLFRRDTQKDNHHSQVIESRYNQVVQSIQRILSQTPISQKFIIENNAGGGGRIGATLEELTYFHKEITSDRLAFCVDTQHLFATGIDVRGRREFADWLEKFDEEIGIDHLVCVHANDSKTDLGSKHDRHENIGKGKIGKSGFQNILSQPLLMDTPIILEVPGYEDKGPDKKNIEAIKNLILSQT